MVTVKGDIYLQQPVKYIPVLKLFRYLLNHIGIAREGDHGRSVHSTYGDFILTALNQLCCFSRGNSSSQHSSLIGSFKLYATPVENEQHGLFQGKCSRSICSRHLSNAVPHHCTRSDSQCLPHFKKGNLNGEDGRLRNMGLTDS